MDKIIKRIPIGYISNTDREVIDYSNHRSKIYKIQCRKCNSVINGASKTLHSPCKKCSYIKNVPLQDLRKQIFYKYRYNANLKNVVFEISFDFFCQKISEDCYYCGRQPSAIWKSNRREQNSVVYNGIDRKINNVGYTENNCVPCCSECNYFKKDKSTNEFKEMVERWSVRMDTWND